MKYILSLLLLVFITSYVGNAQQLCDKNGKKLFGKVKVVNSFADFKVRITNNYADLDVTPVNGFANSCGKWEFTDAFEDFTVQFVNDFPDFTIYMVSGNPYPTESEFKAGDNCTLNGKKMYGRVKVVDDYADFKVKVVKSQADLEVKITTQKPDKCGLWHFVDSHENFTIQFVNDFPDFTIEFK